MLEFNYSNLRSEKNKLPISIRSALPVVFARFPRHLSIFRKILIGFAILESLTTYEHILQYRFSDFIRLQ